MVEFVKPIAEWGAAIIEIIGIGILTLFAIYSIFFAAVKLVRGDSNDNVLGSTRQTLGRGILLGLEFLVAADIIHTVAVELTFATVGVLAIIVLIRTFLSFTLDLELTGSWPWQKKKEKSD